MMVIPRKLMNSWCLLFFVLSTRLEFALCFEDNTKNIVLIKVFDLKRSPTKDPLVDLRSRLNETPESGNHTMTSNILIDQLNQSSNQVLMNQSGKDEIPQNNLSKTPENQIETYEKSHNNNESAKRSRTPMETLKTVQNRVKSSNENKISQDEIETFRTSSNLTWIENEISKQNEYDIGTVNSFDSLLIPYVQSEAQNKSSKHQTDILKNTDYPKQEFLQHNQTKNMMRQSPETILSNQRTWNEIFETLPVENHNIEVALSDNATYTEILPAQIAGKTSHYETEQKSAISDLTSGISQNETTTLIPTVDENDEMTRQLFSDLEDLPSGNRTTEDEFDIFLARDTQNFEGSPDPKQIIDGLSVPTQDIERLPDTNSKISPNQESTSDQTSTTGNVSGNGQNLSRLSKQEESSLNIRSRKSIYNEYWHTEIFPPTPPVLAKRKTPLIPSNSTLMANVFSTPRSEQQASFSLGMFKVNRQFPPNSAITPVMGISPLAGTVTNTSLAEKVTNTIMAEKGNSTSVSDNVNSSPMSTTVNNTAELEPSPTVFNFLPRLSGNTGEMQCELCSGLLIKQDFVLSVASCVRNNAEFTDSSTNDSSIIYHIRIQITLYDGTVGYAQRSYLWNQIFLLQVQFGEGTPRKYHLFFPHKSIPLGASIPSECRIEGHVYTDVKGKGHRSQYTVTTLGRNSVYKHCPASTTSEFAALLQDYDNVMCAYRLDATDSEDSKQSLCDYLPGAPLFCPELQGLLYTTYFRSIEPAHTFVGGRSINEDGSSTHMVTYPDETMNVVNEILVQYNLTNKVRSNPTRSEKIRNQQLTDQSNGPEIDKYQPNSYILENNRRSQSRSKTPPRNTTFNGNRFKLMSTENRSLAKPNRIGAEQGTPIFTRSNSCGSVKEVALFINTHFNVIWIKRTVRTYTGFRSEAMRQGSNILNFVVLTMTMVVVFYK